MDGALPKWARADICWINRAKRLERLPLWVSARGKFDTILGVAHEDTGAVSFWFFRSKQRRGIIRCADDAIAERAEEYLPLPVIDHTESEP